MIKKRLNLLPYHHIFYELRHASMDAILKSVIEHSIADLGFDIQTKLADVRNCDYSGMEDIKTVIFNQVHALLASNFPATRKITVAKIAELTYQINIHED